MDKAIVDKLRLNMIGMDKAFIRLEEALHENNDDDIHVSISELLLWTLTIDEWHKKYQKKYDDVKKKDESGKLLFGLRFAYNVLKHNMRIAEIPIKTGGTKFPMKLPTKFKPIEVTWRMNDEIKVTEGESSNQRFNYSKYIEGKSVLDTFKSAITFIKRENLKFIN